MNKVLISGNLGADPEIRTTSGGTSVGDLRVAVNERKKKGDEWVDHTEWFRVTVWGRTAENCARYLKKGSKVLVEGRLETQKWTDKEGKDQYTTKVIAENVEFLSGGNGNGGGQGTGGGGGSAGGGARREPEPSGPVNGPDEDIPF